MEQKIKDLIAKYRESLKRLDYETKTSKGTAWALSEGESQQLRRVIADLEKLL